MGVEEPLGGPAGRGVRHDRSRDLGQISLGEGVVRLAAMTAAPTDEKEQCAHPVPWQDSDILQLRKEWIQACEDLFINQTDELPPLREINHKIPLIDESKVYHHRQPKCPDAFKPALMAKVERYTKAGWWVPITAS